jgi:pSer/pThr/pTyr-binding forkhead associated (FHA) protein
MSENFCHECGQDLRAERQKLMAAAAPPPDVVTDDMPYLETLDRTDEQLEYVLSRNRVVLGTAAGSDVVVGDVFQGHETVSPRHAELRKESDAFMLIDRESEHGTFVNDERTSEKLLSDGDEIRLGSVRFVYRVPQA